MSKKIRLVSVALVVFVVVLMAFAGTALAAHGDHSNVASSVHNVTDGLTGDPCSGCHTPHGAGGTFLWAGTIDAAAAAANPLDGGIGSSSDIQKLCYGCHDATGEGYRVGRYVFSSDYENHRTKATTAMRAAKAQIVGGVYTPVDPTARGTGIYTVVDSTDKIVASTTAYGAGSDCDRCHDPHENVDHNFLRYYAYGGTTTVYTQRGGNFCGNCHSGNNSTTSSGMNKNHKIDVAPSAVAKPWDAIWDPYASPQDFSGTRLFSGTGVADANGLFQHPVTTAANGGKVYCMTCHTPHGAVKEYEMADATYIVQNTTNTKVVPGRVYPINSMTVNPHLNPAWTEGSTTVPKFLPFDRTSQATGQASVYLCVNCHDNTPTP